jgi:GT2 family glycosyltransferase
MRASTCFGRLRPAAWGVRLVGMRISVIIVSLNGRSRIAMPLEALRRCDPAPFETIVVDNGSSDGLSKFVAAHYPEVHLVRAPQNLGFAGGNNLGIVNARGDVVLLLNDDTEPEPGWLAPIVEAFLGDARLGIIGCQLLYPNTGEVQHLGGILHANGLSDHAGWGERPRGDGALLPAGDYVTGAAMAIRREVIATVGMLDAGFWPIYFEETDFCARAARVGWKLAVASGSRVVHHESQSQDGRMSARFLRTYHRNRIRFLLKNRTLGQWPRVLRAEARWIMTGARWDQFIPCVLAWSSAPFQWLEIRASLRRGRRR